MSKKYNVIGKIIKNKRPYLIVETPFGAALQSVNHYESGHEATIRTSVNPTEFFINKCIAKFGADGNDDLSEVIYVGCKVKIKVIDKYFGPYWVTPDSYLSGSRSPLAAIEKLRDTFKSKKEDVFLKIEDLHNGLEVLSTNYTNANTHILVRDKYGICSMTPSSLLMGLKTNIKSAVDKNAYFAAMAKEVHGDKYDYSLVNYINAKTKVKILSENGIFEQTPNSHINGRGCPVEGKKASTLASINNPAGWTYTNWGNISKRSKHFTGFKVYFLECWDNETEERFYKIGRTFTDVRWRFRSKATMPYQYNILYTIELDDPKRICELEQEYKNNHKEFKYIPNKNFNGMYECFSKLIKTNNGTLI